jgi:hypothetical protein
MFGTALQAVADHIDQLDLALDQLAMRDRNYDRFALMLVDNVVELTIHQYARDKDFENELSIRAGKPHFDQKSITAALGPHFDAKVKFARSTNFVSSEVADTLTYLHSFRNTAYHRGLRHERILHALTLLYFRTICSVWESYDPGGWSSSSRDQISHRAMKYLGTARYGVGKTNPYRSAFERLREVAEEMGDTLVADLTEDMAATIKRADDAISFIETNQPGKPMNRDQIILDAQAWQLAFSDEGKAFAAKHRAPKKPVHKYVSWFVEKFPITTRTDPVPSWRRRLESLRREKNPHAALKKYCDFMNQTQEIRERIHAHEEGLDAWIQEQIDIARGK